VHRAAARHLVRGPVAGARLALDAAAAYQSGNTCGAGLSGIIGALLALPIASAALMLIEELRVDLPGTVERPEDTAAKGQDEREEGEYERRTQRTPVEDASALAVDIARKRKEKEENERE
jgi:hypothetical protein